MERGLIRMNERIQELKDKLWTEEYWTNPNTDKLLPAQLEKFAKLIVREYSYDCMDVTSNSEHIQFVAKKWGVDL